MFTSLEVGNIVFKINDKTDWKYETQRNISDLRVR